MPQKPRRSARLALKSRKEATATVTTPTEAQPRQRATNISATPRPITTIILAGEALDRVLDFALEEFDDNSIRLTQVKLRCFDDPPAKKERQWRNNQAPLYDRLALLTLAHVCQTFRNRVLPILWETVMLETVQAVALYDSFLASTKDAVSTYGRHVCNVDFDWSCQPRGLRKWSLSDYQAEFQPDATLLECAFSQRFSKTLVAFSQNKLLMLKHNAGDGQSWYNTTDGPDGKGEVVGITDPAGLDMALARIFTCFTHLQSLRWTATVLPIPEIVAHVIERTAGDGFESLQIFSVQDRVRRNPHHPFYFRSSDVPGTVQLLKICDGHEKINDNMTPGDWFVVDEHEPFGIRILPHVKPSDDDAPSARWVVETCLAGARKNLKEVMLSHDRVLWQEDLWPLWIRLDVTLDEPEKTHSFVYDAVPRMRNHVDVIQYASSQFDALDTVRRAIKLYDGLKYGDWLMIIVADLVKINAAEMKMVRYSMDTTDDVVGWNALRRRRMTLVATDLVLEQLIKGHRLRRRVAKCWEG